MACSDQETKRGVMRLITWPAYTAIGDIDVGDSAKAAGVLETLYAARRLLLEEEAIITPAHNMYKSVTF